MEFIAVPNLGTDKLHFSPGKYKVQEHFRAEIVNPEEASLPGSCVKCQRTVAKVTENAFF